MKNESTGHRGEITLKEAAALSGYSSDYIGQLIRRGKLPGRQVYQNVVWVTNRQAVLDYIEKEHARRTGEDLAVRLRRLKLGFLNNPRFFTVLKYILMVLAALLLVFAVLLFYILSTSFDKALDHRSLLHQEAAP